MVSYGFELAVSEISLVLFTTLAPASIVACVAISLFMAFGKLYKAELYTLNKSFALPLSLSMAGLIASATHLGDPSNALYVLSKVGQSPLSTEVACMIVFLFSGGLFWVYGFAEAPRGNIRKCLCLFLVIAALAALTGIAFAYNARTIVTWATVYTPSSVYVEAMCGGSLLFSVLFLLAFEKKFKSLVNLSLAVAGLFFLVRVALIFFQWVDLSLLENSFGTLAENAEGYLYAQVLFVILGANAFGFMLVGRNRSNLQKFFAIGSLVILFASLFCVRFGFYMLHMTYGLGV